jgi:hypothetical protein
MLMEDQRRRGWFGAGLGLIAIVVVFAANAGRFLVIDAPEPSDVIVVLAGETDRRPARALQLMEQGYARRELLDVPATARIYEFAQIELAQKYIQDLPQGKSIGVCIIKGMSTRDESRDVGKCLANEDGSRVLIVTSEFHTRRALSIFRREVPGKAFSVAAARDSSQFGMKWWSQRQWAKTCVEEWLRFFWWKAVDQWR